MAALRGRSCSCVDLIVRARRLRFVGVATIGARSVEDEFGWLAPRLGNAAEEEVANVGHDRSAAGGNAVLGYEDEKARQNVANLASGLKFLQFTDEGSTEVGFLADEALAEVMSAEAVVEIGDGHAATAAGRKRVLAAGRVGEGFLENIGLSGLFVHFWTPRKCVGYAIPGVFVRVANKGLAGA